MDSHLRFGFLHSKLAGLVEFDNTLAIGASGVLAGIDFVKINISSGKHIFPQLGWEGGAQWVTNNSLFGVSEISHVIFLEEQGST